jgi:DNA-binding CsgD family transcriptional regulator
LPQLLAGDSAALIAQSRGVQVATIRTQAARVLAKTGASNLRALASMVAALG